MIKRALVSVFNKTGVLDFSKFLAENGVEIISTGGTYKHLKENQLFYFLRYNEINKIKHKHHHCMHYRSLQVFLVLHSFPHFYPFLTIYN